MPTFAVKTAKSVVEKSSGGEGKILKVDQPSQNVLAESPQKALLRPVVTQKNSPPKSGSSAEIESKTNETRLGILKQLTNNGAGSSDAASNTRTIQLGTWGKIPIVVRKARKPEENGKEPYKPPATEQLQKKMKLSTVPKVVPLINTVGNQSKLIPLTFPAAAAQATLNTPTTAVNSSVPHSQTKSAKKDSTKPMSILEATLTSAPKDPIPNGTTKSKPEMSSSACLPVGLSDDQPSKNENYPDKGINPSIAISKQIKKPKCVISYEKGVTRLVAVERRTVTMVDASVQVSIPLFDAESQGTQVTHNAVSSESGSIQPQTTSTLPLHQKPFVVLDSNGKKVFAIPKLILNNYGGAKKFVIEGKGVKRKAESPIENLTQNDFNGTALPSSVTISQAQQPSLMSPHSIVSKAIAGKTVSGLTADASMSFETLTTSSCKTLSSISTSQQNSSISSESTGTLHYVTAPKLPHLNLKSDSVLLSDSPSVSHVITSDSLILPLNLPVQFESHTGSSLQHTICVPTSTKIQSLPNNSESIILPLNSPIGTQPLNNDNTSMGVFHVIMPNSINTTNGKHHLEHEMGVDWNILKPVEQVTASTKPQTKVGNLSSQPIVQKTGLTSSSPSNNLNKFASVTGEDVLGGKALSSSSAAPSKSAMENFVKAAFMDFKHCFTFNNDGQLPVHAAIEYNDVPALKRQCIVLKARKASVDIKNAHDETPLQLALYFGHTQCIRLLLEHGANCRFFDQDGNSPLHLAVLYADDALKFLLVPGRFNESFINYLNDEGFSALHLAAQCDKVEAISLLIKFGADIDLSDGKSGRTALFHAVERKNYKSQQILEKYGANIKEPTFTGATPFSMTRTDAIAQLASGQNTFGEIIDSDTLLKPRRLRIGKVK